MVAPFIAGTISCWIMLVTVGISIRNIIKKSQKKLHYIRTTTVSAVFGIGWAVGLARPATEHAGGVILDVLFLVTVGLLGVVLFVTSCLISSQIRAIWKNHFCKSCLHTRKPNDDKCDKIPMSLSTQKPVLKFREDSVPPLPVVLKSVVFIENQSAININEQTDLSVTKSPPGSDDEHIVEHTDLSVTKSPPGSDNEHIDEHADLSVTKSPPGSDDEHIDEQTDLSITKSPPGSDNEHTTDLSVIKLPLDCDDECTDLPVAKTLFGSNEHFDIQLPAGLSQLVDLPDIDPPDPDEETQL